jgi:hypothetical protein
MEITFSCAGKDLYDQSENHVIKLNFEKREIHECLKCNICIDREINIPFYTTEEYLKRFLQEVNILQDHIEGEARLFDTYEIIAVQNNSDFPK